MGMYRVVAVVEQMSVSLSDAAKSVADALRAIDAEMSLLQARLANDADQLKRAVDQADVNDGDRAALMAALARVQETANAVAGFAHRDRG